MSDYIEKELEEFDFKRVWFKICFLTSKLHAGTYINNSNEKVTKIKTKGIIKPNDQNFTFDDFISFFNKDTDLKQEKLNK